MKILIDKAQRLWKIPQPALGPMRFTRRRLSSRGVDLIDLGSIIPEIPDIIAKSAERSHESAENVTADDMMIYDLKKKISEKHLPLSLCKLDPEKEIIITPGIQMTASLLALAMLNPGDVVAIPDPGMQYLRTSVCLADAVPQAYSLAERNDYIPNIPSLTEPPAKKLKLIFVNYPNNPTTSMTDSYFYRDLLKSIKFENILVISDSAYIHPGDGDAVSVLQAKGAGKKAVELHSFSTSFGLRGIGFAAGHRDIILILKELLTALGYYPDIFRLNLTSKALDHATELFDQRMDSLKIRRERTSQSLKELGWRIRDGKYTPFMWVRPTARSSSLAFARRLISKAGVRLSPGSDFGEAGEGWQRLTLHPDGALLIEALDRISHHSRIWQRKYRPRG